MRPTIMGNWEFTAPSPHAATETAPAFRLHVVGIPSVTFVDDPYYELHWLREQLIQKQQRSKQYMVAWRATRESRINIVDFFRVKKPRIRFRSENNLAAQEKLSATRDTHLSARMAAKRGTLRSCRK